MARIPTYQKDIYISDLDRIIGTDGDTNELVTKNFFLGDIAEYVIDKFIDPDAVSFTIPVLRDTQDNLGSNATRITGSIMSQDINPDGTKITIAGLLQVDKEAKIKGKLTDGVAVSGQLVLNSSLNAAGITIKAPAHDDLPVSYTMELPNDIGTSGAQLTTDGVGKVYWADAEDDNLTVAGDVGNGTIDLDTQTLNIVGGTNVATTMLNQTLTISAAGFITGSGTQGFLPIWSGSGTNLSDSKVSNFNGIVYIDDRLRVTDTGQSSFNGQVTIPTTPVAATDAASKAYVDSLIYTWTLAGDSGADQAISSGDKVTLIGGTNINTVMDQAIGSDKPITINLNDAVTLAGALTVNAAGSFDGQVTIPITPIAGTDAASKAYVDSQNTGQVSGTGTTNVLPIWSDGPNGVLSDSIVSEETGTAYGATKNLVVDGNIYQSNMGTSVSIGENALANGTAGSLGENVAIGKDSLNALTTGTNNIGIGVSTLVNHTTGRNNIAIGKNSQTGQTTGLGNISLGFNSLPGNNVGNTNIVIGHTAVQNVGTGSQGISSNVILGTGAVNATTITGGLLNSVIIGTDALQEADATSIANTVFIGDSAGKFIEANANRDIGIGFSAFFGNNNGFNSAGENVAIGANANGSNLQTGVTRSIKIGSDSGTAGSYAVNISAVNTNSYNINNALGEHAAIIGGANISIQGAEAAFTGGGRNNTINSGATGGAILGGFDNNVNGGGSAGMALGSNLEVNGSNQVVLGRFNVANNNSKLIVGAGFSNANRINAFEVKNTGLIKLGKYGQSTPTFPVGGSAYNILVTQPNNEVREVDPEAFSPQIMPSTDYTANPGSVINAGGIGTRLVKISWGTGGNGTATLRLPIASNFANKTLQIITDGTFDVGGGKKLDIEGSFGTGDTIDGGTSFELSKKYEGVTLWSDGTEWFIIQAKAH